MKAFPVVGWILIAFLLLASFWLDVANVLQGGGIDFRNRITGVRLLLHRIDPYTYKWQRTSPEDYGDPYNNPLLAVSKTTASPTLLLLHLPLAEMPYRLAQFLWLPLQWMLLLGTGWLWFRQSAGPLPKRLLVVFVVGFTVTAAWRLHAERGQIYVFLLFVLGVWFTATRHPGWGNHFATGLLAGLLIALRPPFALLLPFLVLHRRGQLIGAITGLIIAVMLPSFILPSCWPDYFSAMGIHASLYLNAIDPAPPPQAFPPRMEGIPTDILANYVVIPYADFSILGFLRWLGVAPFPALPVLLAAGVGFGCWLWQSRRQNLDFLLLGLAACFFLVDLFLPAYRDSYNDVLVVNVVGLGLLLQTRLSLAMAFCLLALPLGWAIYLFAPMHNGLIDLPSLFLTIGTILFLMVRVPLVFWRK